MDQLIERNKKISLILLFLLILGALSFPVIFGILGTILPSMGYFLDVSDNLTLKYFLLTFQLPGIEKSIYLSISVGIVTDAKPKRFATLVFLSESKFDFVKKSSFSNNF